MSFPVLWGALGHTLPRDSLEHIGPIPHIQITLWTNRLLDQEEIRASFSTAALI